jgi:hypothetical protein
VPNKPFGNTRRLAADKAANERLGYRRTAVRLDAILAPSKLADPMYVEFLRLTDCLSHRDAEAFLPPLRRLVVTLAPSRSPQSHGRVKRPASGQTEGLCPDVVL